MDNYSQLLERVARASGLEFAEIERKVEAKRAKLSGLISKEGAVQIIAAELGITFDNELMKISELVEGMKRARVIGKVTQIFPIRSYNKNGREGKIASFLLGDASSNVRVVLWDTNHISLVENGSLKVGSVIEIMNASVRNGEMHLSAFSDIKDSAEKLGEVKTRKDSLAGTFLEAKPGSYMKIRATVVHMFDPKYFDDKKDGRKRALVNLVLDDGHETMRCVVNEEKLMSFGLTNEDIFSAEAFAAKKSNILGEERVFVGSFKNNTYFNKIEMNLESSEAINPDNLIKELEQNS